MKSLENAKKKKKEKEKMMILVNGIGKKQGI